ncbi:Reverse transcriptase domain [Cinara cedri]|uniref:Reverse transcriptase domain n=1 Tax=Cinara cedri TaxID=506608 RepID=A0A5E4MJN7_9HEMI|nr:Reverse transcriptase domain [Cinara cedri]
MATSLLNSSVLWVEIYSRHLERVFLPHDIYSELDIVQCQQLSTPREKIKHFTPLEDVNVIDANLIPKKSLSYVEISPKMLKEFPKKAIIRLTHIYNTILRLEYIPEQWKRAKVIMLLKPGKPLEDVTSYRPISFLPGLSKLLEKCLLKRLKPIIEEKHLIPNYLFGCRNKHSTIDQVQRVTNVISEALEEKHYCCGVFLDLAQASDKVWHKGFFIKLCDQLPHTWCALFELYLTDRQFRVIHKEAITEWKDILAGVPQDSVLGSILYLLYTTDTPNDNNTTVAILTEDTAILSTSKNHLTATDNLQELIDNVWTRRWKMPSMPRCHLPLYDTAYKS